MVKDGHVRYLMVMQLKGRSTDLKGRSTDLVHVAGYMYRIQ